MTTYVDHVLEPSETVRYRTTVSWIVYVPSLLLTFMAAMFLLAAGSNPAGEVIAALGALAALSNFLSAWFRRWTTEIAVTDRRVIIKHGFIRATMEMNLQKIESVDVDQSLIGRIFDYGAVTIRGVGSSYEPLRLIDAPLKLRSTVTAG
jgi:uncharacterized membrane protein YdbT with pleckstrin-like domain